MIVLRLIVFLTTTRSFLLTAITILSCAAASSLPGLLFNTGLPGDLENLKNLEKPGKRQK